MTRHVRNKGCIPLLHKEGIITKPFVSKAKREIPWHNGLSSFERLYAHQTLASVRRYAHFKPFSGLIPSDSLDFLLVSQYDHALDLFGDKVIPCLQMETFGNATWRRLRNTRDLKPRPDPKTPEYSFSKLLPADVRLQFDTYNHSHPVLISGIKERDHLFHVKLMNSSHHSPQTNAGYCRQDRDGTFFQY